MLPTACFIFRILKIVELLRDDRPTRMLSGGGARRLDRHESAVCVGGKFFLLQSYVRQIRLLRRNDGQPTQARRVFPNLKHVFPHYF
jgi:hypothetical protein